MPFYSAPSCLIKPPKNLFARNCEERREILIGSSAEFGSAVDI